LKEWQGGSAALLLATFSSNDFVLSGSTDGFQAETIILRLFGSF
jgi:hypothetical protein